MEIKCDECGKVFSREQKYFDSYEAYKVKYPSAARHFQRKIKNCDPCIKLKINRALKSLPKILKSLAS